MLPSFVSKVLGICVLLTFSFILFTKQKAIAHFTTDSFLVKSRLLKKAILSTPMRNNIMKKMLMMIMDFKKKNLHKMKRRWKSQNLKKLKKKGRQPSPKKRRKRILFRARNKSTKKRFSKNLTKRKSERRDIRR